MGSRFDGQHPMESWTIGDPSFLSCNYKWRDKFSSRMAPLLHALVGLYYQELIKPKKKVPKKRTNVDSAVNSAYTMYLDILTPSSNLRQDQMSQVWKTENHADVEFGVFEEVSYEYLKENTKGQ